MPSNSQPANPTHGSTAIIRGNFNKMLMLKEKIGKVEKQMTEALAEVRETFKHSGNKGTSNENNFSDFVRQYLPRRFEIGNGEIIDSFGNRSGQADIVIVSDDHPFAFSPNRPGLFFIEGVLSVGEIKTVLTSQELKNTLNNSVLYKNLKMTHSKSSITITNNSDFKRYYEHPPFFLFCYESQLSLTTIKRLIEEFVMEKSIDNFKVIDGIFVLGKGWIINFGDGEGSFQFGTPDGNVFTDWVVKDSNSVLFDFFTYLSATMPKTIRFEPIIVNYLFTKDQIKI